MSQPQGPRRPTITDVARAAGVSATTVSHALNDRGYVDPRTRSHVKRIAAELGYRPNLRAQRLRTGRANSIALVSSMPFAVAGGTSRLGFLMEIAATAAESALEQGLALVLVPPKEGAKSLLDELDIDGAVVIEPVADDSQIAQLRQRGVHVVSIGRQPDGDEALPYVDLQAGAAGTLLLEHLHSQGGRRIALLIGSQRRHSYIDVEAVYRAFAQAHDLEPLVVHADEAGGEAAGRRACKQLLDTRPCVDAICAPVDAFAVGAVAALEATGRQVPGDVMVATRYDGLRARSCEPPLTAIELHLERVATLAVERLLASIRGEARPPVVVGPTPELVVRASSRRQ